MLNFDAIRESFTDPFKEAWTGPERAHKGDTGIQPAIVAGPYDPETNSVPVILLNAGGKPITFPVRPPYQGPHPGTGEAFELYEGQPVHVVFENGQATGRDAKGTVDPAYYTRKDRPAPMAASWNNPETTGGRVRVFPAGPDGKLGRVEHVDNESNVYAVNVGSTHLDDWGNQSILNTGSNETQNAQQTRNSAKKLDRTADRLLA